MADDFTFTPGTGATGAAKDIGGVLHPKVIATESDGSDSGLAAKIGSLTETAPATDTASSGLNGRLQRIAQRVTSLIALLPTALTGSGNFKVAIQEAVSIAVTGTFWQATQPVSAASLPLPSGAATSAKQPALGTAGTASSDVITIQGIASMTAVKTDGSGVTQPTSIADGSNTTFGAKADAKSTATDTTAVSAMSVFKQISASVQAIATSIAGTLTVATHAVTQSGTWTMQPGNTANTTPWLFSLRPETSGGLSMSKTVSAASTNATSVKGSAGQVYAIEVFNTNASARYLKLYNKSSAPTVGTDTPVKTLAIPGNANGAGVALSIPQGLAFSSGIAFALTTGIADADTGAVAASEIVVNIDYK